MNRKLPEPYYSRLPDSQVWRSSFRDDFEIADEVLSMFCGAFMFSIDERYKFRPDDTIMAIYRAVYPSRWTPDSLEHPILIEALEKKFNFTFDPATLEKTASFLQIVAVIKDAQPLHRPIPASTREIMETDKQARPIFRVLAGFLSILCLLALIAAVLVEGVKSWKFVLSGTCFLILMVYVTATGRAPQKFR